MSQRRARTLTVASAALVAALLTAPAAAAQPPPGNPDEKAAALAGPAIVQLQMDWQAWVFDEDEILFNDRQPYTLTTTCTGFLVNPDGHIVTAGHCVDSGTGEGGIGQSFVDLAAQEAVANETYVPNDPAQVFQHGLLNWRVEGTNTNSPPDLTVTVTRAVAASGEEFAEPLQARVVDVEPLTEGDVALVKIEERGLPTLQLAEGDVGIGTPVLSIGFPGSTAAVTDPSLEPTFKAGQISAQRTLEGNPFAETSAALTGGMSGGPTVDREGRVIGVNSFGPGGEPQAFNYIAVGSSLEGLLARNGVTNAPGPVDEAYRAGLDALFAGDANAALGQFDRVLDVAPSHQQAQEFRRLAIERGGVEAPPVAAAPAEGGLSTTVIVLIAVGAALLAAVATAGALLVTRRRRTPPAAAAPGAPYPPYPPRGGGYGTGYPPEAAVDAPPTPAALPAPPWAPSPAEPADRTPPVVPQPRAGEPPVPVPAAAAGAPGPGALDQAPTATPPNGAAGPDGAAQETTVSTVLRPTPAATCASCGRPRGADDRFCGNCGSRLE